MTIRFLGDALTCIRCITNLEWQYTQYIAIPNTCNKTHNTPPPVHLGTSALSPLSGSQFVLSKWKNGVINDTSSPSIPPLLECPVALIWQYTVPSLSPVLPSVSCMFLTLPAGSQSLLYVFGSVPVSHEYLLVASISH